MKDRIVSVAKRRGRLWIALPTVLLVVLAACGGAGTDTDAAAEGDTEAGSAAPATYTSADEVAHALEAGDIECAEFEKPDLSPRTREDNPDITDHGRCVQHRETGTIRIAIYISTAQEDWMYFCADLFESGCVYAPNWLVLFRLSSGMDPHDEAWDELAERMGVVLGAERAFYVW